jgi:hypothetical protein
VDAEDVPLEIDVRPSQSERLADPQLGSNTFARWLPLEDANTPRRPALLTNPLTEGLVA